MSNKNSIHFYQDNFTLTKKLLQVDQTHCIHHGYYEKGIRTHTQSISNMNNFIARLLKLSPKTNQPQKILDAGCGVGGPLIYLAKKFPNIKFTGINIIPDHIKMAQSLAKENNLSNTNFLVRDFIDTNLPPNHFDAICLIESACYAPQKPILLHEMHRILKPGGTLVITDAFRTPIQLNPILTNIYHSFCKGWALPDLITTKEFISHLRKEHFHNITNKSITKHVTRTIIRGDILSVPYLTSLTTKKIFLGKNYHISKDPQFPGISPILTSILGIKKAITYNAITAIKLQ